MSKISKWWRTFCWVRLDTWRFGPLHILIYLRGWNWPKIKLGNYLKGSVIERGPWIVFEPGFGYLELSWQPHWDDKTEISNPPFGC